MTSSYDRRAFLAGTARAGAAFTVLGGAGVLLEACGGSKSGGKSGGATTAPPFNRHTIAVAGVANPKSAKSGGAGRMGTEAEEASIDPTTAHFDSTGVMYARCVYDTLMILEAKTGNVVPYLAESVTSEKSATQWTITLRKGIEFHDGTPLDGDALYYNMMAFYDSPLVNFALTYLDKKNPVTKTGQYGVTINMTDPWYAFPAWLCGYIGGQLAYIFSPTAKKKSSSYLSTHPVGTGPFVYEQWVPGSHFTLTKNPHYWRKDAFGKPLPYLDSWEFQPLPNVEARYEALLSGSIDIMHTDDDPTIEQIRTNKSITYTEDDELTLGEPDCEFAMINTQDHVMKDIRLRQAAAYAFDVESYLAVVGRGVVKPITGPFPEPSPWATGKPTGYPSFDLAKAQSLVQAWSHDHGGQKPTVTYSTTASPTSETDAGLAAQYFTNAGFDVSTKAVSQEAFISDAVEGNYQIFAWRQFANVDPDLNYIFWSDVTTKPPFVINFARNIDTKVQTALDNARQSTDQEYRKEQYSIVADRFAIDLPYIWSNRDVWNVAATKDLQNWNHPSTPTGTNALPMLSGIIWPTEIWKD